MKEVFRIKIGINTLSRIAFIVLGGLLIFSGLGKIVKPPDMAHIWFAGFFGSGLTKVLITALPYCEIVVGILLILRIKIKYLAWLAMGLILLFIVNNVWLISIGEGWESCGECLGWGIDAWPGVSLYIDLIMMWVLLSGVLYYRKWEKEQWAY